MDSRLEGSTENNMKLLPEYAKILIAGVVFQNQWSWYVTEREYWFLNVEMEDRFGIEVLDETTAAAFFKNIAEYKAATSDLTRMLIELEEAFESYDDVLGFMPTIYVNFDDKVLYSLFPEPMSFEHYVPDGWTGEYRDFYALVPERERYWVIQGGSFFERMWKKFRA